MYVSYRKTYTEHIIKEKKIIILKGNSFILYCKFIETKKEIINLIVFQRK